MNTLMLVALAVVALCYCGGKYCPSVLKQNKEVVLGVLVGMALSSFAGLKLEGLMNWEDVGYDNRPKTIDEHRERLSDNRTKEHWMRECCNELDMNADHKCHHEGWMKTINSAFEYAQHHQETCGGR